MSIQWTLIACFLYVEMLVVLLLVWPIVSPMRLQKFFKSGFFQSIHNRAFVYFVFLYGVLILLLLDSIREVNKYATVDIDHSHSHLDTEMQNHMKLFRAQRNFYISTFALFLSVVIRRLIAIISAQAVLLAQNEAAMRQAQSATSTARSLLSQRTTGESAQNDSNEAHDKAISELKSQIKELQAKNLDLENYLTKEKKDKEAVKSQAESLTKEYDRLNEEHAKLLQAGGDKKSD